MPNLLWYC